MRLRETPQAYVRRQTAALLRSPLGTALSYYSAGGLVFSVLLSVHGAWCRWALGVALWGGVCGVAAVQEGAATSWWRSPCLPASEDAVCGMHLRLEHLSNHRDLQAGRAARCAAGGTSRPAACAGRRRGAGGRQRGAAQVRCGVHTRGGGVG